MWSAERSGDGDAPAMDVRLSREKRFGVQLGCVAPGTGGLAVAALFVARLACAGAGR